jgi:hypothetical protein
MKIMRIKNYYFIKTYFVRYFKKQEGKLTKEFQLFW